MIKTQEDFFNKIFTSHFIARVRKGCSRFACERELETEHNWNILTPTLMAVSVVSFLFFDAKPEAQGPLCWVIAFFIASYQHLLWTQTPSGFPRAPSAGCGFPYHIFLRLELQLNWPSDSSGNWTGTGTQLSYTPTRSLKSNV